jgi:hypothetical protein
VAETEDVTQPVLIAVTALPGAMFWRQNTGTFRTMDGLRVVKASVNGVGDIMGAYFGRAVAIETKTLTGPLRKTQVRFRAKWEKAGGLYIVARSSEDALTALQKCRGATGRALLGETGTG